MRQSNVIIMCDLIARHRTQHSYLASLLPRCLWRWLTNELDLNVELLSNLDLNTRTEAVAVNSRLNCIRSFWRKQKLIIISIQNYN